MYLPSVILFLVLFQFSSSSKTYTTLTKGSSLSPGDTLVSSPTAIFTAGFYPVGDNAYCFATWFTHVNSTVIWMANRDEPVNGKNTKLSLLNSGNLVLKDAGYLLVWTTATQSAYVLQLHDNGNLVLSDKTNVTIWQSFDYPTNTLLPQQPLTKDMELISSRSSTNHSSGFYKLYFDNDNVLRLLYDGILLRSVFWPTPWLNSWEAGRTTFNTSKIVVLDLYGNFVSTDEFTFKTSDAGKGPQRRMTLDPDGIVRVYSLDINEHVWKVTWQHDIEPCKIHGICGANSLCTYSPDLGRRCSCLPGYKIKNRYDWADGCVEDFKEIPCNNNSLSSNSRSFIHITHSEFYGYDTGYFQNTTLENCSSRCWSRCDCRGFQYKYEKERGFYSCYPKTLLFNGYQSSDFQDGMYIRLPNYKLASMKNIPDRESALQCPNPTVEIGRPYQKKHESTWWKSLAWCTGALGSIEVICLLMFLWKTGTSSKTGKWDHFQVLTGFKRYTYAELKKASRNFSEEIGRGVSGVVYKGWLSDNRIAAIKCLNDAMQGEAEFMAEVGTIGSLNHANLIERWGYCAEGKHRLLVYEYLENGSLEENLNSNKLLDFKKRFDVAVGAAKGLAYLHEECLEWVLHCDVKPQNILLDLNYQPKVADFGLSKQGKRSGVENTNVSTVRGTRGYMAPEWVLNLPITSKVDVYSYGIVVLEMVTGKSPKELDVESINGGKMEHKNGNGEIDEGSLLSIWIGENVDPRLGGEYDVNKVEKMVKVALKCVQEKRDLRPTMTQVVDMLLRDEDTMS